jgi:hypothetical protein
LLLPVFLPSHLPFFTYLIIIIFDLLFSFSLLFYDLTLRAVCSPTWKDFPLIMATHATCAPQTTRALPHPQGSNTVSLPSLIADSQDRTFTSWLAFPWRILLKFSLFSSLFLFHSMIILFENIKHSLSTWSK